MASRSRRVLFVGRLAYSAPKYRLLQDMKEVKEQGVYWRDLRTSLDMQYTTQQKKLDHIHACLKDIETRGETPTFSQPRFEVSKIIPKLNSSAAETGPFHQHGKRGVQMYV